MSLEKVAAAGFLDELQKIFEGMQVGDREKIASAFHDQALGNVSFEQVAEFLKEAGFFDRIRSFVGGGNENGIPMNSLASQFSDSNPLTGMGSSLANSARSAGGAIANKFQGAAGAVGNFLRGGTNAQGIPMHGLGSQMAESNPLSGMGSSLAGSARAAGGAIAGKLQGAANAVGGVLRGGTNAQGIPMQGLGQMMASSNPFHGMGSSLAQNVPSAARAMAGGAGRLMGGAMRPVLAH